MNVIKYAFEWKFTFKWMLGNPFKQIHIKEAEAAK